MKRICVILTLLALCLTASAETELPSATVRYGTLIVRVPDSYIEQELASGNHETLGLDNVQDSVSTDREEIERTARALLHGDDLTFFLNELNTNGSTFPYRSVSVWAAPDAYNCVMCVRHTGDAWYTVVRLIDPLQGEQTLVFNVSVAELQVRDGELHCSDVPSGDILFTAPVNIQNMDGQKAVWSKKDTVLYETLGADLVVYTAPRDASRKSDDADLYIGGKRVPMSGYITGYAGKKGTEIYCAVLEGDECERVKGGEKVSVKSYSY